MLHVPLTPPAIFQNVADRHMTIKTISLDIRIPSDIDSSIAMGIEREKDVDDVA
jgi:hypothetical protein